jgi:peroxiredoxin
MTTRIHRPTIQRGQVIPDFTLDNAAGSKISSRSYYLRRNLIIVFLPSVLDQHWSDWVNQFVKHLSTVPTEDVQAFLIASSDTVLDEIGPPTSSVGHIEALADREQKVAKRFGYDGQDGLVFVTDRYGVVFHQASGGPNDKELDPAEIPGWIKFIACQCS